MFVDLPAPLQYLTRCGERLVDLLLGRESPLEMLFPNGSTEIADGLYNTSPVSRYSNAIARAIIGAPQAVKARLLALQEQFAADELMVITITGDYASRLRSYQLLADAFSLSPM